MNQLNTYMPAEFAPHHGTLMIWPWRPGSWSHDAAKAREAFTKIIKTILKSEDLYLLVGANDLSSALQSLAPIPANLHVIPFETDDAWARDTGATFVLTRSDKPKRMGIDWQFNAWGGTYDGLYASWDNDQLVASKICEELGDEVICARHFVLEGGSIHVDGEGTLLTTEECLLSPGRNPSMSREEIEETLKQYLGISKIIWLPEGIFQDETNGHVDNFCCFSAPGEVLLAWTDDANDPQYARSKKALELLARETDAKGRPFKIRKLPIPAVPECITEEDLAGFAFEEGEDIREAGERLAASYVNFYITNGHVLVPQFGGANADSDRMALDILRECFPTRSIVGIYARDILTGGGNIHCITQQIPAV